MATRRSTWSPACVLAAIVLLCAFPASGSALAGTNTWNGTSGDWFDAAKWSNGVPGIGDSAVIAGGSVLLTNSTDGLDSLTVAGGTLVFSNWTTSLNASLVTIRSGGVVTHALCNTNPVIENTNRVAITCGDLVIAAGGSINANFAGYRGGGGAAAKRGQGPGGGLGIGGGSYGGLGAYGGGNDPGPAGPTYGDAHEPSDPGSGGGGTIAYSSTPGRPGGGAVRIIATGTVTVNGTITASALRDHGDLCGSGSGGSIYISCRRFAATNGWILAQGGGKAGTYWAYAGSGGGGRIAIVYDPDAQSLANITDPPRAYISAGGGFYVNGGFYANRDTMGQPGTVYLTDSSFYPSSNSLHGGVVTIPGFMNWTVDNLVLSNDASSFPAGFSLTVSNDLAVRGAGGGLLLTNSMLSVGRDLIVDANYYGYSRICGGSTSRVWIGRDLVIRQKELTFYGTATNGDALNVGRDCVVTNGGVLRILAARTNGVAPSYGALLNVGGDLVIAGSSWVYPHSDNTNGGSALFKAANVRILATNSGFNASGLGFRGAVLGSWGASGPGAGAVYAGGGYGGRGGYINGGRGLGGAAYGDANAPVHAGSGGGPWVNASGPNGGSGGGLVRIEALQTVTVNGEINVDGQSGTGINSLWSGGGSGGGVYIRCRTFEGSSMGSVRANGGNGTTNNTSGGGGGGRIAIWRVKGEYLGSVSATNGVAGNATYTNSGLPGTIVWGQIPQPATVVVVR